MTKRLSMRYRIEALEARVESLISEKCDLVRRLADAESADSITKSALVSARSELAESREQWRRASEERGKLIDLLIGVVQR